MLNKILADLKKQLAECGIDSASVSISCNCQDAETSTECATKIMSSGFNGQLSETSETHLYPDGHGAFRWVSVVGDRDTINIFYEVEVS